MTDDDKQPPAKHLPFNEGLPTRPDVDLLLRTWPSPKVGDRFSYEAVEKLLGLTREQARFRTVTWQWRRRLHEQSVVVECEAGAAFYVASADQISAGTYGVLRTVGRKAHKHRRKLASAITTVESPKQRAVIEHQARLMSFVEKDSKKHRMNLLPSTATAEQPKIEPPKKQSSG